MTEYLYHIDDDDNVLGKMTRAEMRKKSLLHRAVAVLVFNSKGEILVHRRTKTKDIHPGVYDLKVSGCVDYGESYEECALRELNEEIGAVDVELELLFIHKNQEHHDHCIVKIYTTVYDGPVKAQESEIDWFKFMELDDVKKMIGAEEFNPGGVLDFNEYLEKHND